MKNMTVIVNCFDYKAIAQKAHRINKLPSIVCYERPADFPKDPVLDYLGMVRFNRAPGDDNCIMEVWL